jgi:putative hemolysin
MHDSYPFWWDLIIILFIIIINSLFVLSEMSLLTSNKAKLHKMSSRSKGAKKAVQILKQPEIFLSTTQIGITLMSALLGLYGGTSISELLAHQIEILPHLGHYLKDYSMIIASCFSLATITYFAVLSEILPKRIAMLQPEKIASLTAYATAFIIKITYPLSFILTASTKYLLKYFKIEDNSNNVSIEEIKFVLSQAVNVGTLHKTEHDLLKRLINLMNMQVGAIMTHRNKIVYLDLKDSDQNNKDKLKKYNFNYFPVLNGSLDKIIGIVSVKSLFSHQTVNNISLAEAAKASPLVFVPEMARITKLIDLFSSQQVKTALVVDEYGDLEGIVTLNDIMRHFLGDLALLMEGKKSTLVEKDDGSFLVDGSTSIEELLELLHLHSLPGDEEEDYRTLGGFLLKQLGTLPKVGDLVKTDKYLFKVTKMDKKRVDRVLVMQVQSQVNQ